MKLLKSSLILLFVTGCTSVPVQTVKVAVPVKCSYTPVDPPVLYFSQAKESDTLFDKAKMLIAEVLERDAYEKQLEAALKACTE